MRCRKLLGCLVLLFFLVYLVGRPAPARANDVTTPLLISAGVAGGVALILVIAIVFADRDDPDFLDALVPMKPGSEALSSQRSLRYGPRCRDADGAPALFCW